MDNIAGKKSSLTWAVNITVILLVIIWLIPTVGLLGASVRDRDQNAPVPEALHENGVFLIRPLAGYGLAGEPRLTRHARYLRGGAEGGVTHRFRLWS